MSAIENLFHLSQPFTTAAGQRVIQLNLRRLTVKDLKAARKISEKPSEWDDILLSRATGLLVEDFDNMDLGDWLALQQRFQDLTGMGKRSEGTEASAGPVGAVVSVSAE